MTPPTRPGRPLEALLLAAAFAAAHTQAPLYYSNQNQYLLHGLAAGGLGHLRHDWLATAADPTPVFSALVMAGYQYLGEWSYQAAYFALLMVYFLGVRALVAALPGIPDTRAFRVLWAAGFTAAHAAVLRVASVGLCGVDYPWYFQAGVAGQYLLGPGLQPSAFGVLLVAGLAAFAHRRPGLAGFLTAAACGFHATYLPAAASLLVGMGVVMFRSDANPGPAAFRGLLAASAVLVPVGAYTLFTFGPADPVTFAKAQQILAEVRIPHHAVIDRWLDPVAAAQLGWAAVGLALLWGSRVFPVLLVAAVVGLVLSVAQYESGNPTFALTFPWRISVVLVPVATAVIAARVAAVLARWPQLGWVGLGGVVLLAAGGVGVTVARVGYRTGEDEAPLYDFVRATAGPKDVYLLPVRIPAVQTGKGSVSTSFTPPPRPDPGSNLIPVDLQRFRLHTGAAIYADFKAVPYRDREVLEWHRRVRQAERWFDDGEWKEYETVLRIAGVTHVVAPAGSPPEADYLVEVHRDPAYRVYRLR
ncbi:MAG: hypothetical protein C0501_22180 [Isosphaera sp.]|nr:hypothetical protein [Isosphaera sp.]